MKKTFKNATKVVLLKGLPAYSIYRKAFFFMTSMVCTSRNCPSLAIMHQNNFLLRPLLTCVFVDFIIGFPLSGFEDDEVISTEEDGRKQARAYYKGCPWTP
jgi:hypothetical protein